MMKATHHSRSLLLLPLMLAVACGGRSANNPGRHTYASPAQPAERYASESDDGGGGQRVAPSSERMSTHSPAPPHGAALDNYESEPMDDAETRPGLGTQFGEQRHSRVRRRAFVRATRSPFAQVAIHYNDEDGIRAQSWYSGTSFQALRASTPAGGISISVVDEYGQLLRGGTGNGRTYVVGRDEQRYSLVIQNETGGTYEVVASVDGLDVVDGEPASYEKRGYVIEPYGTLTIEGFRTSTEAVAAFRFGTVEESYAARTSGDRNVGVIGVAFFAERGSRWTRDEVERRETANPFPGGFARPPGLIH